MKGIVLAGGTGKGTIFDVAIDIRRDSPTFGRWFGIELSEKNRMMRRYSRWYI